MPLKSRGRWTVDGGWWTVNGEAVDGGRWLADCPPSTDHHPRLLEQGHSFYA